ncbi:hypothetical protein Trydic_g2385 [Trypoxylus dichotomus]
MDHCNFTDFPLKNLKLSFYGEHFSEDSYIDLKRDDVKRYLKRDAVPLKYIISSCPKSEMMTCKQETDADPLVEQADPIGIPSESLLTKIKEEIIDDDTDTVESQIHPFFRYNARYTNFVTTIIPRPT